MVRQERTSGRETGRLGKPHPEQDRIEGDGPPGPSPGWSLEATGNRRSREMATARLRRGTELGL